jgi:hypothetical protein
VGDRYLPNVWLPAGASLEGGHNVYWRVTERIREYELVQVAQSSLPIAQRRFLLIVLVAISITFILAACIESRKINQARFHCAKLNQRIISSQLYWDGEGCVMKTEKG